MVLVLDDVQWADLASRDAITYLVAGFRSQRMVALATYRDEDLGCPWLPAVPAVRAAVLWAEPVTARAVAVCRDPLGRRAPLVVPWLSRRAEQYAPTSNFALAPNVTASADIYSYGG